MPISKFVALSLPRFLAPGVITLLAVLLVVAAGILATRPPIGWLPLTGEATLLLGVLLGAQAALAALTLAVTSFVVQGAGTTRGGGDRIYGEYVRRSLVRPMLWSSLGAVGVTGLVLLVEELASASGVDVVPGRRNLLLLAVAAFAANVALPVVLFERAVRLTRHDEWRRLQHDLYAVDTRSAVRVFLERRRRALAGLTNDAPDLTDVFPDLGEEVANEAVRALLGDALRAMGEWRQADFEWALDTARALVGEAMEEIDAATEQGQETWAPPGSHPEWPPLAEWGRNLYPFREEVIIRGGSWYGNQLASLDLRLAGMGVERRAGELFTSGLRGYASSYEIASRVGNADFRQVFRRRAWLYLRDIFRGDSDDELQYLRELARHQALLLFYAMRSGHRDDFASLRRDFAAVLRNIRQRSERRAPFSEEAPTWVGEAERDGRIGLAQVGGIAMRVAEPGTVANTQQYLDMSRAEYASLEHVVRDVARAVDMHNDNPFFWSDVLDSPAVAADWTAGSPSNYALTFFSLRLLELAIDPMPAVDFSGGAWLLLNSFESSAWMAEKYVRADTEGPSFEQRRDLVTAALQEAIERERQPPPSPSEA